MRDDVSGEPANVNDAGANVQVAFAGSVPHASETTPLKPPTGVNVRVVVALEPRATVRLAGLARTEKFGVTTAWVRVVDVLPV